MAGTIAHITPIRGVNDEGKGKKHALHRLIHATEADILWLHDDDVQLPTAGDTEALQAMEQTDLMILPLRMQADYPTLIEQLQVIEYAALQSLTVRTARQGRPILCSGANMLVRREVWLEAEPHLHSEIPSGDDMFLLEYCKRTGKRIGVCDAPAFVATIHAQPTLRDLMRQRRRWAGKAPHYTDKDIRRYGMLTAIALTLQAVCPPLVLINLPIEWHLLRSATDAEGKRMRYKTWHVILLAIIYPYYALAALIGGMLRPKKW